MQRIFLVFSPSGQKSLFLYPLHNFSYGIFGTFLIVNIFWIFTKSSFRVLFSHTQVAVSRTLSQNLSQSLLFFTFITIFWKFSFHASQPFEHPTKSTSDQPDCPHRTPHRTLSPRRTVQLPDPSRKFSLLIAHPRPIIRTTPSSPRNLAFYYPIALPLTTYHAHFLISLHVFHIVFFRAPKNALNSSIRANI